MLNVKTVLAKSSIEGIGVFADQKIDKGALIWEFTPGIDIVLDQFGYLSKIQYEFIYKYAYWDKQLDKWILPADNDRFTNHRDEPNTRPLGNEGKVYAICDIEEGEEITINYFDIDKYAQDKFNEEV